MKKFNVIKFLFFIYIILISLIAFTPTKTVDTGNDKTNHILSFIVFSILYYFSFKSKYRIVLYGILFGIYIETVQYFLPYRSSDFLDILADSIGIGIGILILDYFMKKGIIKDGEKQKTDNNTKLSHR